MYYKIVLLGEPGVGKTTLRRSYMGERLKKNYVQTLGVDFSVKTFNDCAFQIWDIAGQSNLASIKNYIEFASAAIVVFDVMEQSSLNHSKKWINHVISILPDNTPIVLVGNKIDLRTIDDGIPKLLINRIKNSIVEDFESTNRKFVYFETSALMGENVNSVFEWMYKILNREEIE